MLGKEKGTEEVHIVWGKGLESLDFTGEGTYLFYDLIVPLSGVREKADLLRINSLLLNISCGVQ